MDNWRRSGLEPHLQLLSNLPHEPVARGPSATGLFGASQPGFGLMLSSRRKVLPHLAMRIPGVRIQRPRREWSQRPTHLAAAQRSPCAPWPWRWACLRSHGTAQNRLLLIAQDSEAGEEGALVGVGGAGDGGGGFNERENNTRTSCKE